MTIEDAIDEVETDLRMNLYEPGSKLERAMKLALEALKRLKINRINNTFYVHQLLPGETNE